MVTGFVLPSTVLGQPPNRARPKAGDWLVFDGGEKSGERITPALLELDQRPVAALAKEPETETLRDGSRLNRVMVTKLDLARLDNATGDLTADGVIAYSAVCTHTGCDVTNWDPDNLFMACPCHESKFDVYNSAKVVGGPAPRPLAVLPLRLDGDAIVIADIFQGRVGFTQQF
jgi:Rieske Fe-S protein